VPALIPIDIMARSKRC